MQKGSAPVGGIIRGRVLERLVLSILKFSQTVKTLATSSPMDTQSDLEVILEFLEEYYRQSSAENEVKLHHSEEERSAPVAEAPYEQQWMYCEPPITKLEPEPFLALNAPPALSQCTAAAPPECGSLPNSTRQTTKHRAMAAGSGRKVRLFHFLFEMLEDPSMAHCVAWVPAAAGVFRFSSRNKDQVATLWGQRKGNKRPMTYQKMSRALRNYARSGEIFKVKKKLTYQFSQDTLTLLQRCRPRDL